MFLGQKNKKTMKLKNLRAIKTPILRADDSQDNQNATTTQAKKNRQKWSTFSWGRGGGNELNP